MTPLLAALFLTVAPVPTADLPPQPSTEPVHIHPSRWTGVFLSSLAGTVAPAVVGVIGLTQIGRDGFQIALASMGLLPLSVLFPLVAGWLTDEGEGWGARLGAALIPLGVTLGTVLGVGLLAYVVGAIYGADKTGFLGGSGIHGAFFAFFSMIGSLPLGAVIGAIVCANQMVALGEKARERKEQWPTVSVAINPAGGASAALSFAF